MKKKIRAIQYGVGPIGASIARLMREKQAIEIIGAIDMDPAKVGRDQRGANARVERWARRIQSASRAKCANRPERQESRG